MAKKVQLKKLPKVRPSHPEVRGFFLIAAGVFALISYASFFYQAPQKNWLGILGYLTAFGSEYLFGWGAYLIPSYLIWLGSRFLLRGKLNYLAYDHFYFGMLLASSCMLLTLFADIFPDQVHRWGDRVVWETFSINRPYTRIVERFNLGGIPAYFLYADLPYLSLQRVLSPIGTTLIASSVALVSFLLLTRVRLIANLRLLGVVVAQSSRLFVALWKQLRKWRANAAKQTASVSIPKAPPAMRVNVPEPRPQPVAQQVVKMVAPVLPAMAIRASSKDGVFKLPSVDLLADPRKKIDSPALKKDLMRQAAILEEALKSFGIEAKVGEIHSGPTITSFEVHPPIGVKVQKIKALEDDLALNMQAKSIRIIAPIPGKAAVGVEVPTTHPQEVNFKEMLHYYQHNKQQRRMALPLLIGKAVNGDWVTADLTRMPHLLIAGATGSGKSVCINTIVMSLLMNSDPDELQLVMIDPKKVELTQYSSLPHMIAPVVTEPRGAYAALQWLVQEMQRRYDLLKRLGLRNISAFNERTPKAEEEGAEPPIPKHLPFIVAIIDEFADLMMVSSADLETPIARIAQMARAVGIHLILATQRPSREVITGIIKANITSRIAFKVANRINSQIILDETGAETLLGNGDLLFLPPGTSQLLRAQGAFISDEEIHRVVRALCEERSPRYLIPSFDALETTFLDNGMGGGSSKNAGADALYDQALAIVLQTKNASTTYLQRKLKIGYARAASLMDELEANGVISPQEGAKPRRVLSEEFEP